MTRLHLTRGINVPQTHHYLIHFAGELGVKGRRTRDRFTDRLASNIADSLRSHGATFELEKRWSRILLRSATDDLAPVVSRVFGVNSVALAQRRPWQTLEDLLTSGEELFRRVVKDRTFAVRVKRGDQANKISFRSPDVERQLGARLLPSAAGVNLKNPEVEVRIELQGDYAFFFSGKQAGHGGLPIGTEGRALSLVSGGFDSGVASWLMLRRGVRLEYLFFNLGGDRHRDGVLEVMKVISDRWSFGYRPRLHIVDFRPVVAELETHCPGPQRQLLLKRQMLRVADGLARATRCQALVTGEAVGQVSSQTLPNLALLSRTTDLPILRPLITYGKDEIMSLARDIGTYDLSSQVPEYCGLSPKGSEVSGSDDVVGKIEQRLDSQLISRLLDERVVLELRSLDLARLKAPELEVASMPPDARIMDLRTQRAFDGWHYPGAQHLEYTKALQGLEDFEGGQTYVFYCEIGLKSAHLAELLQANEIRAYHFRGGLKNLLRHAEERFDPALRAAVSPVFIDDGIEDSDDSDDSDD